MERKRVRRRSLLAVRLSRLIAGVLLCSVVLVVQGAERNGEGTTKYGDVDISRLRNADRNPEQWAAMGRTLNGTYYSPLSQINTALKSLEPVDTSSSVGAADLRGLRCA